MRSRVGGIVGLAALIALASGVALGWRWGATTIADQRADELADMTRQRDDVLERLAAQRPLLRQEALHPSERALEEMFAMFPAKHPLGDWSPADSRFEDCWFPSLDELQLHGWLLWRPNPRAAVLHIHGNAGNLTHRAWLAELLHDEFDCSVLIFDYRGYGRSEGTPTLDGLVRDARAARDELARRQGIEPSQVVLQGESLGGAVAVQLAAEDGARGLVLENTFSSLREAASSHWPPALVRLVVSNRLDSRTAIRNYRGPLLQRHGTADSVIPYASGEALFREANQPKRFVMARGGEHNDPPPPEFLKALGEFLGALPAPSSEPAGP
ncbi:MAG: alpha/beta hydrolase [Planctomyces sp.]|nr:alpha/beta hydrolase [Planctomyces sp.]